MKEDDPVLLGSFLKPIFNSLKENMNCVCDDQLRLLGWFARLISPRGFRRFILEHLPISDKVMEDADDFPS
jgi:hypothetical protein